MEIWSVAVALSVTVVALEIVWVLMRGAHNYRGYLALLAVDACVLVYAMRDPRFGSEAVGPWSQLGPVLCALLVLVPGLLDRVMRRALSVERVGLAARLASVKEILQPGRAATAERELYAELAGVRQGKLDQVVSALRARLVEAEAPEDAHLHDRIITALAFGHRYREAATHYETHVRGEPAYHPGIAIQMVRAYGQLGELEAAAHIVHRLEQAARAREPGALAAIAQARLFFVAHAGGEAALERVLSSKEVGPLPARLVEILRAAAHTEHAVPSPEVERFAAQVAERTLAEARAIAAEPPPKQGATRVLVAANVVAFVLFVALLGDFDSGSQAVRAGGSLHAAVRAGEWWRLWTAMFLHGGGTLPYGLMHLGLNMCGLYLLGRILEPILGWPRLMVVYAVGGLAGNLVSVFNPRPEAILSLGASGAVMGLIGALLVLLFVRRNLWVESSRRTLLINLNVLIVVQLVIGGMVPIVDNFAHVGGLIGGGLAAWLVMPGGLLGSGRLSRGVVLAALALLTATATASVVKVVRARVGQTLAAIPRHDEKIVRVRLSLPSYAQRAIPPVPEWPGEETLLDAVTALSYAPHLVARDGATIETVLGRMAERDKVAIAKQADEDHRSSPSLTPLEPPVMPGFVAAGQREASGKEGQDLYYYGRALDDKQALVVEVNYLGRGTLDEAGRAELARVLVSARIDPE